MKEFKVAPGIGEESTTDKYHVDADGKAWPIYTKRLAIEALPNATSGNVAHGVTGIKLDGHFAVSRLSCSSGTNGATARTNKDSAGLSFSFDATNVVITTTANLSAQAGQMTIEYCKSAD
jgi:hypothetical protein